jgi:N-acetyl-gamma-glutamyl-phosphate reductase
MAYGLASGCNGRTTQTDWFSMPKVFIDGEAGTTGLQIRERLETMPDVDVVSIAPEHRKDRLARRECMLQANLVALCLHDEAAIEAVAIINDLPGEKPKILDASTAHRCAPDWVYGFQELYPGQHNAIARADRVANPGCYATGAIALLRPLLDAGILSPDAPICMSAVSGYSGGGRTMIEAYERSGDAPLFEAYALDLKHKHLPEIMAYTGLTRRPIFVPSVGNFRQGMLVQIPLHLDLLQKPVSIEDLREVLHRHYAQSARHGGTVTVEPATESGKLDALALNNTNRLELRVYGNHDTHQAVLVARLDNLGKGASGAAVQNLRAMLGLPVT